MSAGCNRRAPDNAPRLAALCGACCLIMAHTVDADISIHWGANDSPYLREVQLDMALDQHFSAIGHLLAERKRGTFGAEQTTAELMLAYNYLKYGMHHEAAAVLETLPEDRHLARRVGELWLELANMRFQRGYLEEAHAALAKINDDKIRYALLEQKYNLGALIYLQQDQPAEALKKLLSIRSNSDWGLIGKFNLGTTLIQRGDTKTGRNILEALIPDLYDGPEMLALRDRAYFTLGNLDLQHQDIAGARKNFQAVRLESPYTNNALLGLGLSYAAASAYQDAISLWQELVKHDASDPAVLEALVAIPLSFTELGDHRQSIDNYQHALQIFRDEIRHIDFITAAVEDGSLINTLLQQLITRGDATLRSNTLPALPEFQYLRDLYASHPFQVAINNYRDLRMLEHRLQQWASNIYKIPDMSRTFKKVYVDQIAAQQSTLVATAEELKQHIAKLATAELAKRKLQIIVYTKQALFAMAQNYDTSSVKATLK